MDMNIYQKKPYRALIGFDGYLDEIGHVVKERTDAEHCIFYSDISEFADRISRAAGVSADLETVTEEIRLGGNAPIMANALARFGVETTCIGAMGYPEIRAEFSAMPGNCRLISLCEPARTHAYEFRDGKLMFANASPLDGLTWDALLRHVGREQMIRMLEESDLIALVNWSGVPGTDMIWNGIREEILPMIKGRRKFFFDLADPTKKTAHEIRSVLKRITAFSEYGEVILGMNENEARKVSAALGCAKDSSLADAGRIIYTAAPVSALLIHPVDRCLAVTESEVIEEMGHVVEDPVITTGGGDNFNAGFCMGWLDDRPMRDSMRLGMQVSGYYVGHGKSPSASGIR